jgi:hypothetical protein
MSAGKLSVVDDYEIYTSAQIFSRVAISLHFVMSPLQLSTFLVSNTLFLAKNVYPLTPRVEAGGPRLLTASQSVIMMVFHNNLCGGATRVHKPKWALVIYFFSSYATPNPDVCATKSADYPWISTKSTIHSELHFWKKVTCF